MARGSKSSSSKRGAAKPARATRTRVVAIAPEPAAVLTGAQQLQVLERHDTAAEPSAVSVLQVQANPTGRPSSALSLGASLTIRDVGALLGKLKAQLQLPQPQLDASQLENVDTAGLQLLLAAAAAAQRHGAKLRLIGGNTLLMGAAGSLGLAAPLAAAVEISP